MRKKYLHQPKPGYWYVRIGGRYIGRIYAQPGTEEFDRQYWALLSGKSQESNKSWRKLIESYRKSARWENLKPRTRRDYEKALVYIIEQNGSKDCTKISRKHVIAGMDANTHRTRFANGLSDMISILCEHAIDIGWMTNNPAKGVRKLKVPNERKRPHIPWPDWAIEKWRAEAQPLPRLIFEIGVGSVQRPGDWVGFRWSDYDGENLKVQQGKTGVRLLLPCTGHLKAALDAVQVKRGLTILTLQDGRPMSYRRMAAIMRDERERLELAAYDLHALRYRGVMELAWAGCDDEEIASYSGHASRDMIRKYAGEARQIMRARTAREKRR